MPHDLALAAGRTWRHGVKDTILVICKPEGQAKLTIFVKHSVLVDDTAEKALSPVLTGFDTSVSSFFWPSVFLHCRQARQSI